MPVKPDRREFLKTTLATAATMVAAGPQSLFAPGLAHGEELPGLVVCRGTSPAAMTRAAVDALGGVKRFVKPGNKVIIKPNMSFDRAPGQGSTTHPQVVAELARMCVEAGAAKVSVLDNVLRDPHGCLTVSQIPASCQGIPRTVVSNVQARRLFREVKVPKGSQLKSMEVISDVLDADVLIAAPVGKTHGSSVVSLTMKGMMGLIYDRRSFHGRYDLHEAIVDLCSVLKPKLVVIDGTNILSTGGPGGPGKVIPLNLVIASTDMVAADAQMVALGTWYNRKLKPADVGHIRIAAQRGMGRMDLENLSVKNIQV